MLTLKELTAKVNDLYKASTEAYAKWVEAREADQPADELKAAYEKANNSFKAKTDLLAERIDHEKQSKTHQDFMGAANSLQSVKLPTTAGLASPDDSTINKGILDTQPLDKVKQEYDISGIFFKGLKNVRLQGGLGLSGEEMKMVEPKNAELKKNAGSHAMAIPLRVKAIMLPEFYKEEYDALMREKAGSVPMLSNEATAAGGGSDLYRGSRDDTLYKLGFPPQSIFDRVRKVPASGGSWEGPALTQSDGGSSGSSSELGGVVCSRYVEGIQPTSSRANFEKMTINTFPLGIYTEISKIMLERSQIPLESELALLMRAAYKFRADYEIVNGSGSSQALGILEDSTIDADRKVGRQTADTVTRTDLVNLVHKLNFYQWQGAEIAISQNVWKYLQDTDDGETRPLFKDTVGGELIRTLEGFPWFPSVNNSDLGTQGDVIFGRWKEYFWVQEMEMLLSQSDDFKFGTGLRAYRLDALAGGRARGPRAFSILSDVGDNS